MHYHSSLILWFICLTFSGKLDVVYLDNTYCSPACTFPTRDEATADIIKIIQSHPEHDIVIGLRSLGKETLLCKIAMSLKEWISVPCKFYKTLQLLSAPDVFQNNDNHCRIRVCSFHKVTNKFIADLNEKVKTIAILPTAIYCGIDARPFDNNDKVFIVPYSDHSSYTELMQFVSFLKPCKILPVVSGSARGPFGFSVADRADMSRLYKYLSTTETADRHVPDTVLRFMKGRAFPLLENVKKRNKRKANKKLRVGGVKFVKMGVDYYDSPEECVDQQIIPLADRLNENSAEDNQQDKENMIRDKDNVNQTSHTVPDQKLCQKESEGNPEQDCKDIDNDSMKELGMPESEGFIVTGECNSDNEGILQSLGIEVNSKSSGSDLMNEPVDLDIEDSAETQNEEGKISCNEVDKKYGFTRIENMNKEGESSDSFDSSGSSYTDNVDKNAVASVRKGWIKVKRSLEFESRSRKLKSSNSESQKIFGEMSNKQSSLCKISQGNSMFFGKGKLNTENKSSGNDVMSSSEVDSDEQSQSILDAPDVSKQKKVKAACEGLTEGNLLKAKIVVLTGDTNSCNVDIRDNDAEDCVIINDVSQDSGSSVVVISSDSEKTVPADSHDKYAAVNNMFNDTDSLPVESEIVDIVTGAKSDTDTTDRTPAVDSELGTFESISVIRWQPNLNKVRKQKLHEMLSRFADGTMM